MKPSSHFKTIILFLCLTSLLLAAPAEAQTISVLVGEKESPAAQTAEKLADGKTTFSERTLQKALDKAVAVIQGCAACTVNVKIAGGEYAGKGGIGQFSIPEVIAPQATLRILGGYDPAFKKRAPFSTPSVLLGTENRSAPMLQFEGKKHALKEFVLSGLVLDVAPGNAYDAKTNSLKKGQSCTFAIIALGYLTTEKLVVADNVIMNAAQKAIEPLVRAATPKTEVIIRNNFFLNNLLALVVKSAMFRNKPGRYLVQGNSFILNWPYNPDPTTSNPATVEIGDKYTAESVEIEGNLFAYNVGGAIMPGYDDKSGPTIAIRGNLFFQNAILFGKDQPGAGAVVGKFNRAATYGVYDPSSLEDDFSWQVKGNQVLDPKVPVALVKPGIVNSNSVKAEKTVMNEIRGLFGVNKQGGTVAISNFAPRMGLDLANLPFPKEEKAKGFGVDPDKVEQY